MDADTTKKLLLPHIPFDKRIIPNDMIRSSLFCVSNHNCKREYLKSKKLCSFHSTEIIYTGEELRQDDEDVWLQIIYTAAQAQSNYTEFRPYTFLSEVGWPKRTQYKDVLKTSLTRMSATTLELYNRDFDKGIGFSLIRKFEWCKNGEKLKKWKVWLEPEVVKLFSVLGRMYSKIHWEQRKRLKPLAKWLHAFYSSHNEPEPVHVKRLMQLSGSRMKTLKHFKANLRNSLVELVQVGFLTPEIFIDAQYFVHVKRIHCEYKQVIYE